jgi:hypothetical protein
MNFAHVSSSTVLVLLLYYYYSSTVFSSECHKSQVDTVWCCSVSIIHVVDETVSCTVSYLSQSVITHYSLRSMAVIVNSKRRCCSLVNRTKLRQLLTMKSLSNSLDKVWTLLGTRKYYCTKSKKSYSRLSTRRCSVESERELFLRSVAAPAPPNVSCCCHLPYPVPNNLPVWPVHQCEPFCRVTVPCNFRENPGFTWYFLS